MTENLPIEQLVAEVYTLDRPECLRELRKMDRPRLDFSDEFLDAMSLERLRHVLLAAILQARKSVNAQRQQGRRQA